MQLHVEVHDRPFRENGSEDSRLLRVWEPRGKSRFIFGPGHVYHGDE